MDQLFSVLLNPSQSIRHVHCCTLGSGDHFMLKRALLKMNTDKKSEDTLVVTATCKFANTLPLLLQDLGEAIGLTKDNCKNIDLFMEHLDAVADKLTKKRKILAIFDSEELPNIGPTLLSAFLSIPSAYSKTRILTVSDAPWGFSELTEAAGSSQPVEMFLQDELDVVENKLIASVSKKSKLKPSLVKLVVQSVSAHVHDKNLILKICDRIHELNENNKASSEHVTNITKMLPIILNEIESKALLRQANSAHSIEEEILELPLLDQILLLASFCATHNSAAGDKRFFVKHHGREQRNENRERAVELAAEQKDTGPKAADVQRVFFIFQVLLQQYKEDLEKNWKLSIASSQFNPMPQFASLENTSQICRASSYANVDQPKIKCMISMDSAKKIAKKLDITLEDYLERRV